MKTGFFRNNKHISKHISWDILAMDTCTVSIGMGRPEMKTDVVSRTVLLEQPCSLPCRLAWGAT